MVDSTWIVAEQRRRFRILGELGRGSFGTVYRAELVGEGGFSRIVALKVLNADSEQVPEYAQRLRDEARVLGLIRHRAVVYVDELIRLGERWAVVMEHVCGADLLRILSLGPIPLGPALLAAAEVAAALEVVHGATDRDGTPMGLLHRDLKPGNILITPHGEVKVVDFGVAHSKLASREAHTVDATFGSPGYMPPERLELDERPAGDVYSLGVVLFEMITGIRFGPPRLEPTRHQALVEQRVVLLREADAPEPVVELIGEMLAFEHEHRPVAGEVERRLLQLQARFDHASSLKAWARQVLPDVVEPAKGQADALAEWRPTVTFHSASSEALAAAMALPEPEPEPSGTFAPGFPELSLERSARSQQALPLLQAIDTMAETLLRDPARPPRGRRGGWAAPWVLLAAMSWFPGIVLVWAALGLAWWVGS